ncbi:MAG: tetratricopeptide repeat protein, partial [Pseudomonadota bacterium]
MKALAVTAVLAGIWPFGGDDEPPKDQTIESLEKREIEVAPSEVIEDSSELARRNYRLFLELVSDDTVLSAEAMRRLADLELEAGELSDLADNIESLESAGYDTAIQLYRRLLERYPDYPRNDMVRYQLARAYESNRQPETALTTLNELMADYPDTPLLDEVEFRRGEMLFINKRYGDAEAAYESVVNVGESSQYYEQSLYKLGWSRFKQSFYDESFDPFMTLLDRKLPPDSESVEVDLLDGLSRPELELVRDTFRVLSISFSYLEGHDSVAGYFAETGAPDYAFIIYRNLGDLYLSQERFADAADTYRAFVENDPYHFRAPGLQTQVIEAYRQGGFPDQVLAAKGEFVELYGMDGPFWDERERDAFPSVVANLKSHLSDLAQFYHARAQADGSREDYSVAARWYRKYLAYFPDDADSAKTNFLLAEILFDSEDFIAATEEYERTSYGYPLHQRSAEAGYAALLSYRAHEATLQDPAAISEWHGRYLDSGLKFAAAYPDHPEAAPVLTTVAEDLFEQGQFDLAIGVASIVVQRQPPPERALLDTSWTVIAHSHFDLGQYAEAEAAYVALRDYADAADAERQVEIRERIASSIYKQGEQARAAGDLGGAVTSFSRVAQVVPDSPVREVAEYDAAAALIEMGQWGRAAQVLERFREDFPDSEYADETTQKLAVVYLEDGNQTRAAEEFERIADAPSATPEIRREAQWQAIELYRETGQTGRESDLLARVIEESDEPLGEALEARLRLADLADERGDSG